MLARKKSFVSKNNILAAEITPEERARIASRALRKERSLHASAVGRSKKRVSNNKSKTSYSAATKKSILINNTIQEKGNYHYL